MRLPCLALLPLLAFVLVVLPHGPEAVAAPDTCLGESPTITSDGGTVNGTEGDDVISTTGDVTIDAKGGKDRICAERGTVDAGAGDDQVLGTAPSCCTELRVDLGPGDDTYNGTLGSSRITGGGGTNTITTGIGDDSVLSGEDGEPNLDVIDLGLGNDSLSLRLPDGSAVSATGGAGYNTIGVTGAETETGDWTVNLDGSYFRDGELLATYTGFSGETFVRFGPAAHAEVNGTDHGDHVTVASGEVDIDLDAGNDSVYAYEGTVRGSMQGGSGTDAFATYAGRIWADLQSGEIRVDKTVQFYVRGFEGHTFDGGTQRIHGSIDNDHIYVMGCRATVTAGRGDDRVLVQPGEDSGCATNRLVINGGPGRDVLTGSRKPERLEGGKGNDKLYGGSNGDVLVGGGGRDLADGGGGAHDRCDAEKEKSCEDPVVD